MSTSFLNASSQGRPRRPLFAPPALLAAPAALGAPASRRGPAGPAPVTSARTLPGSKVLIPGLVLQKMGTAAGGGATSQVISSFSPAVAAIDISNRANFVEDPQDPYRRPKALQHLTANEMAELFGFRAAQKSIGPKAIGISEGAKVQQAKRDQKAVDFEFWSGQGFPYVFPKGGQDVFLKAGRLILSTIAAVALDAWDRGTGSKNSSDATGYDFLAESLVKLVESASITANSETSKFVEVGYGPIGFVAPGASPLGDFHQTTDLDLFGYHAIDRLTQMAGSLVGGFNGVSPKMPNMLMPHVSTPGLSGLPEEGTVDETADGALGAAPAQVFDAPSFFRGRRFGLWQGGYMYQIRPRESLVDVAAYFRQQPSSIPDLVRANPHLPMAQRGGYNVPQITEGDLLWIPTEWVLGRARGAHESLPDVNRGSLAGTGGSLGDPCGDDPYSRDCYEAQGGDSFCAGMTDDQWIQNEACLRYFTGTGKPATSTPTGGSGSKPATGSTKPATSSGGTKTSTPAKTATGTKKTAAPATGTGFLAEHKTGAIVGGVAAALLLAGGGYYAWKKSHAA